MNYIITIFEFLTYFGMLLSFFGCFEKKDRTILIGFILFSVSAFVTIFIGRTDTYKNYEFNKRIESYYDIEQYAFKGDKLFVQFTDQDDLVVYPENEIPDEVLEQITLQ